MDRITVDLVDDLALGAGILAAGCGSPPGLGIEPLCQALAECGPVPLLAATELPSDAFVLPVALLGEPDRARFPDVAGIRRVVQAAEQHTGRRCAAVVALEIGGLNAPVAVFAAAVAGLPCVDGDGTGRGFARLDLTLLRVCGLAVSPAVVCDGDGNLVTVDSPDDEAVHRLVQAAVTDMGGSAVVAAYPMTAAQCAAAVTAGSLRRCVRLGRAARALRGRSDGEIAQRLAAFDAERLFTGRIMHVARTGDPGSGRGTATVESVSGPPRVMRIDFQRGNLVASEDGVVRTTVPDLISVVDADSWLPAEIGRLAPDHHVHVLAIPADERWRSGVGIAAAGPRSFGYDIDYEPLREVSNGAEGAAVETVRNRRLFRQHNRPLHPDRVENLT